ncbi:viral A-type inclusion protein [Runella sp.]|uniref:viral A-type inclusion protein n=1 Tax=Runella sp. TaxID=1960881 RepID=UPI003D0D0871
MKKFIISLSLCILIFACGQDKAAVEQTEKEVFVIHDEVMPKMGQLMELKNGLSKEITTIDSLIKISSNDSLQKRKEEALTLSIALTEADQGMMDWMHDYNSDSLKALTGETALKAMTAEKTKITAVRDKMLESMTKAEQFLKK